MLFHLPRRWRLAAAALATTLGMASAAQAGYVVINADPLFTASPLEGYGWTATGALYLPEGCVGSSGSAGPAVNVPASSSGPCGAEAGLMLSDVSVRFYRASDMGTVSTVQLGSYLPLLDSAAPDTPQRLGSVTFSTTADGAIDRVIGLATTTSQTYTTSLPNLGSTGPALLDVSFVLNFNLFVPMFEVPGGLSVGRLGASTLADVEGIGSSLTYTVTNLAAAFTATSLADKVTASGLTDNNPLRVPEPGTLGLVLLAVAGAAWRGRRPLSRG